MLSRRVCLAAIAVVLGLGCGDDGTSDSTTISSADGGTLTGPPGTSSQGTATGDPDCAQVLPGCVDPIELCEGGLCDCQCNDPPACPPEAQQTDPPTTCTNAGQVCGAATVCCTCNVFSGCGDDPIWRCIDGSNDAACPPAIPTLGDGCTTEGLICNYCVSGNPTAIGCSNGEYANLGQFSCAGG